MMFWGAFHEHFVSRCWEGSFPVLKKALLTGHSMCYYWTKSPQSKISADVSSIYGPGKYSFLLHLPISQFSSVTQSCLTLSDPMNHSMPGHPVHHQLPEFTHTHVHGVSDAIQPSHPLSSPSPPAFILSQHQGLFQ